MERAITNYLRHLNIPVSKRYCKKRIGSHPDYPSILAVVDTPTTFMNGYELPAASRMMDLAALIPALTDVFGNQNGLKTMKLNVVSTKISEK